MTGPISKAKSLSFTFLSKSTKKFAIVKSPVSKTNLTFLLDCKAFNLNNNFNSKEFISKKVSFLVKGSVNGIRDIE